jgi:hypothetical protein
MWLKLKLPQTNILVLANVELFPRCRDNKYNDTRHNDT